MIPYHSLFKGQSSTLEYLITVQHLLHNGKLDFIWLANEGQFDVVKLMVNDRTFSINLNARHVNGMTPFDLALSTVIRYSKEVRQKLNFGMNVEKNVDLVITGSGLWNQIK